MHLSPERQKELQDFIKETDGLAFHKRALLWLQKHVGEKVYAQEFAIIPGKDGNPINHNMRRVFELRDEQGYNIINHKFAEAEKYGLKVDEWILLDKDPNPKLIRSRGVNKRIMFEVFSRDGFRCQFCGRTKNDDDPFKKDTKIRLHVGHIIAHKQKDDGDYYKLESIEDMDEDETLTKEDFITLCNVCNEGMKNNDLKKLSSVELISKFDEKEQKNIYESLKKKFN